MLFHMSHSHTPENCPAHDAARLKTLAEVMKSARERGVNVRSLHLAPWEHTFYGILEAESAEDIERWLDPILGLGMAKLTPVTDAMSSIGQRLEG